MVPNANGAGLVWWLLAETDRPTTLHLELVGDGHVRTAALGPASSHAHPLSELRAEHTYTLTVTATDEAGLSAEPRDVVWTTEPLPEVLAALDVTVAGDPARMEPGVTLMDLERYVLALDAWGAVVWYLAIEGFQHSFFRTARGTLVLQRSKTEFRELDVSGRVLQTWRPGPSDGSAIALDILTTHHELIELPDGTFVTLSVERRQVDDYPTSESDPSAPRALATVAGDIVVELAPDGRVLRRYHLLDLLQPDRIGRDSVRYSGFWDPYFGDGHTMDWSHGNALAYDAERDRLLVSLRHQDAVAALDRADGSLAWVLAPTANWDPSALAGTLLAPAGRFAPPYHQHGVTWTPHGTVLVLDNGNRRASAYEPTTPPQLIGSRAVEYAVDPAAGTVTEVWSFGEELDPPYYSTRMGNADWLEETGNVLVVLTAPWDPSLPNTRVLEVTHTEPAEVVWDLQVHTSDRPAYRAHRVEGVGMVWSAR